MKVVELVAKCNEAVKPLAGKVVGWEKYSYSAFHHDVFRSIEPYLEGTELKIGTWVIRLWVEEIVNYVDVAGYNVDVKEYANSKYSRKGRILKVFFETDAKPEDEIEDFVRREKLKYYDKSIKGHIEFIEKTEKSLTDARSYLANIQLKKSLLEKEVENS